MVPRSFIKINFFLIVIYYTPKESIFYDIAISTLANPEKRKVLKPLSLKSSR